MSSIKIAQLLPSLETGGVERGVVDLSNHLSNKNITNHIISSGGKMENDLDYNFAIHHKLPINSKNFLLFPNISRDINAILTKNKINILHIRSRGPAWMVNLIRNKTYKTVSTFHNVYSGNNFIKKFYNKGLANMDHIVANSNYVKEKIIEKYDLQRKDIKVIPRGIDTNFFNVNINNNDINILKQKINFNKNKKIIFFPGRITSWKGQKEFLNVILRFKNDNYLFFFAGDATSKNYFISFKKEIEVKGLTKICKILENLNSNEFRSLLNLSYLVLSVPIIPEGFGRIVSEALSMNKIVLGFDYGGVKDQLNGLNSFFKIRPLDYDEIYLKIRILEKYSKEEIINLTKNLRQHVKDNFSLKNMLENYEHFYNSIL
tara:strand:+ start:1670 stop:2794 length:1125 start_codon:yes stop_codon:yes gene_type:complete